MINIRILLTTGMDWPASSDKCKAPLEYKKYTISGNMKLHIMQLTNCMGKLPFTNYICVGASSRKKPPCGSILGPLPHATTKSLHFGWTLTGGSTAFRFKPTDLLTETLDYVRSNSRKMS